MPLKIIAEHIIKSSVDHAGEMIVRKYTNSIVEVSWNKNNPDYSVSKDDLINLRGILKELGNGEKLMVYIATAEFLMATKDAQVFASSDKAGEFTKANAVLIDNLAKRIAFNFYLKINKPKVPTKGFSSIEKSWDWLLSFEK